MALAELVCLGVVRMSGSLPAVLIGAVAGFAGLFMREMGMIILVAVLLLLNAVYVMQGRIAAVGWLMIGAALPWLILLAPIVIRAIADPEGSATTPETYLGFGGAVVLASLGTALLVVRRDVDPKELRTGTRQSR